MAKPFFKSFSADGYRGLRGLELNGLRRINIIGGLNSSGKTTLLEALFTFVDHLGPFGLLRPLMFRNLPPMNEGGARLVFPPEDKFRFAITTRDGPYQAEYTWELQPPPQGFSASAVPGGTPLTRFESTSQLFGVTALVKYKDTAISHRHYTHANNQIFASDEIQSNIQNPLMPICTMLSRTTLHNPIDIANKFSASILKGHRDRIISLVKEIAPSVNGLELLTFGEQTILYADIEGKLVPASFIGDGALTLLVIAITIIECISKYFKCSGASSTS